MSDERPYSWILLDSVSRAVAGPGAGGGFPTQSEAESWLGENWQELADAGIASVTLMHEGTEVYGPMSLDANDAGGSGGAAGTGGTGSGTQTGSGHGA